MVLIAVLVAAATAAAYWRVGGCDFVNFDDPVYVTENPHVLTGVTVEGAKWAFATTHGANWFPVTWLSHMLDCQLYGVEPGGHHITNVILHVANALLLLVLLYAMTGEPLKCGFVAALFALHPLHVESVAWVSERKDVLSTLLGLLAICAYVRYASRPAIRWYVPTLLLFALSLMAKPMLVTLPFVLLLLDVWPLRRFSVFTPRRSAGGRSRASQAFGLLAEKAPFVLLSVASSGVTLFAQQQGAVVNTNPVAFRVANALIAYGAYIWKTLWPCRLAVFYPLPESLSVWHATGSGALLAGVTFFAARTRRRLPFLAVGWLWFLGALFPVIGVVQVGKQAMADRYTYVPHIGLFIMVAWGVPLLVRERRYGRLVLTGAALTVTGLLAAATYGQVGHWRDSVTLFRHALEVTDRNYLAHNSLGNALKKRGDMEGAASHYREALRICPGHASARNNLGAVLAQQGDVTDALASYASALRLRTNHAAMYYNVADALLRLGDPRSALPLLEVALAIKPGFSQARELADTTRAEAAGPDRPSSTQDRSGTGLNFGARIHTDLGFALAVNGKFRAAIGHFRRALEADSTYAEAHNFLGVALTREGKLKEAVGHFREALRIRPGYAEAKANLDQTVSALGGRR